MSSVVLESHRSNQVEKREIIVLKLAWNNSFHVFFQTVQCMHFCDNYSDRYVGKKTNIIFLFKSIQFPFYPVSVFGDPFVKPETSSPFLLSIST